MTDSCTLPWPAQRRNLLLFAVCTGLQYFAAPVLYVGITQASLCDHLQADTRTANLPGTMYFAMTAVPALIAWLSPQVHVLRRNLSLCYGCTAVMLATTAGLLASPLSPSLKIAVVIVQGGVSGAAMPAAIALLWEVIGRGTSEARRGLALGLAFGCGPLLAVLGSLLQSRLLGGTLFGLEFAGLAFPTGFVVLFAIGALAIALAAVLAWGFVVPPVDVELVRGPWTEVGGLLLGLPMMVLAIAAMQSGERAWGVLAASMATCAFIYHFRAILRQRILLLATLVTILVYSGNMIPSNMNLYSAEALGDLPEKYAGVQNALRFGFKVVAGLTLGWLLTRSNPRTGIVATSLIFLAAPLWAMIAVGPWYLVAFGIYGAGELIGVYAPNYIVSASRPDELRRNMAFVTMLMVPAAPAGYLYGTIVDVVKSSHLEVPGMSPASAGFRLSFLVCAVLIGAGVLLAQTRLPKRPHPRGADS